MRVLGVSWEFWPQFSGGLGVRCYETAKRMQNKISLKYLLPDLGLETPENEVQTLRIKINTEKPETMIQQFNKGCQNLIQEQDPDLVHAHDWFSVNSVPKNTPHVLSIHSTECGRSLGCGDKQKQELEQKGFRKATHIITVSEAMKKEVVQMGADPDKVSVIYGGVDVKRFQTKKQPEQNTVLFVGRLVEQKGPQYLIRSLCFAKNARLMIVGTGPLRHGLDVFAQGLGVRDRVTFMDFVPSSTLSKMYERAKLVVMPSMYEPFGLVALEAMASNRPVILSPYCGISEIAPEMPVIDPSKTKILGEKIQELLSDEELYKTKSEQAIKTAKQYSWEKTTQEILDVYSIF